MDKRLVWGGIGAALFGLIFWRRDWLQVAVDFVAGEEGFSAVPYWDVSRWSWGYGTRAPGSAGTITREQAKVEMKKVLKENNDYLRGLISRELTANQWAALASFAYNLGAGNADNLVEHINNFDDKALKSQWMQYIYVAGEPNDALIARRAREIRLWLS